MCHQEEVHIVEPTLADQAGHCHGYVQSLVRANSTFCYDFHIWLDRQGSGLFQGERCHVRPYFRRRWCKVQKFFHLRSLIQCHKTIFIPTAGRLDLVYLDRILNKKRYQGKIFLHFHQFKMTDKKMSLLEKTAKRYPEFILMAPTERLLNIFKKSGFKNCERVPCPTYAPLYHPARENSSFLKVIYAGAARADKGFPEVVNFLEYLCQKEEDMPIALQISPPFSGRYDEKTQAALSRLNQLSLPKLTLYNKTLNQDDYQQLFFGAICLMVYSPAHYRDKFSGVALDALYAGCPIIGVNDTWIGETVQRFQAGVVLTRRSPENIYEALQLIRRKYMRFVENAKQAGAILFCEHDPVNTLKIIKKLSV